MAIKINNEYKESTLGTKLEGPEGKGTYYLASEENSQIFEIQRNNNFVFYVSGLSQKLGISNNTYAQANADEVLKISVNKTSVPHFKQNVLSLKRGNSTMKFAGTVEFDANSIVLDDFIGAGTLDVLYAWRAKSYDLHNEKVGVASEYKKDAYLLEYTPDYQLVRTWKLLGCWISGLSEDDFSHDSDGKHQITATIEYDKAYLD